MDGRHWRKQEGIAEGLRPERQDTRDCRDPEAALAASGILRSYGVPFPATGLIHLQLQEADGSTTEILADAASSLQQLTSAFGSAEGAIGCWTELSLNLFGVATIRLATEPLTVSAGL